METKANTSCSSSCDDMTISRQLCYKEEQGSDEKQDRLKEIESIFTPASRNSSISMSSDEKKATNRYKRRSRTCFTKYQANNTKSF